MTLPAITDLIYRRLDEWIKNDNITHVYATYTEEEKVKLTLIIGTLLDFQTLTSINVRYNHALADYPNVTVHVLDSNNHFNVGANTYPIWLKSKGYVLPTV